MNFLRKQYLDSLIAKMNNGRVKIITGLRRCGKSYLLFELFAGYLRDSGIQEDQIISLALDEIANAKYRDPFELDKYIRAQIRDSAKKYFILLDEIQFVSDVRNPWGSDDSSRITFVDVLLGLMKIRNADVYVTGSNSKMLSSDVLTQFRDRGDEIRVYPLSFAEFVEEYHGEPKNAWHEYCTYGGMPYAVSLGTHEEKSGYLKKLFELTYVRDVLERYRIQHDKLVLDDLLDIVASAIGSMSNPTKLANTFLSEKNIRINPATVARYLDCFEDSFLICKAVRYDVKGRKYMRSPVKYYFTDIGLRNARLGYRQQEETHIMENIIYCDLIRRGYDVDVGVVEQNTQNAEGRNIRNQLEVDFVVNRGGSRVYIQSALNVEAPEKRQQETASLIRILDSFAKIIVVRDDIMPWRDDNGILYVGVCQFLTDESVMLGAESSGLNRRM